MATACLPAEPAADSKELTGLPPEIGPHVQGPLSAAWISDDLLRNTQEVWSELAGGEISANEAVEILINVKNLAELLLDMNMKEEVTT